MKLIIILVAFPLIRQFLSTLVIAFLLLFPENSALAEDAMNLYPHLKRDDTIESLISHPAFKGFGQHLLTRDGDISNRNLPLSRIQSLLPYHGSVDVDTVLAALNHMVDEAAAGKTIFYDFYTEQQKSSDPSTASTGLFFFRGKPGAPFAVICPGGGFSYVGSFHEGFPYALELSRLGYNAFVLRYRVNGGDRALNATRDLAAAISYIMKNAGSLEVSGSNYSLWGSSAGARMVAYIGTAGTGPFGFPGLAKPGMIMMAYTGHQDYSENDPPTFVIVGENDGIASPAVMKKRVEALRQAGVKVEYHKYKNLGHGFGLGVGTEAEGWIKKAAKFWEDNMPD